MNQSQLALKSIDSDFLMRSALERIRQLEAEVKSLRQQSPVAEKMAWIYQSEKLIKVPLMDILYIRSESNYSRVFLKNGQMYYLSKTLKSWANEISESDFLRCHRSFLVNKKEITEIKRGSNEIVLCNGVIIPTSRRHQKNDVDMLIKNKDARKKTNIARLDFKVHHLTPQMI